MNSALVPVKGLAAGKSRLRGALAREKLPALTLAMLGDVLEALRGVDAIGRIGVVTPDAAVCDAAKRAGAEGLLRGEPLNPALDAAAADWADPGGALLVVLGDVAGAASAELAALFEALDDLGGRGAVLAPARDGGSAALLRRPPHILPNCFGAQSARAHREAARKSGVPFRQLELPSLAIDMDCRGDIAALLQSPGPARRTRALLAELGLAGES